MRQDIEFLEAPHCGVGKSTVCPGQGLFALSNFKEGEVVADYSQTAKKWQRAPFNKMPQVARDCCWWVGESKEIALIARPESLFMRANHSKTPNTEWDVQNKKLVAIREIKTGEEIFYDYRKEIAPPEIKDKPPSWA
jgi:hypothetical protein